jgi:hypothetical protein
MSPAAPKRPFPVTLVALVQLAKAGFLLFLALKVCGFGEAFTTQDAGGSSLVIVCALMALLIGFALYIGNNGFGLLRLEKSARRTLMWNIVAGWLLYGVSFNGLLFGESPFIGTWTNRTIISVFLLDTFLYCCLAFYPDVAQAFGEKDGSDYLP